MDQDEKDISTQLKAAFPYEDNELVKERNWIKIQHKLASSRRKGQSPVVKSIYPISAALLGVALFAVLAKTLIPHYTFPAVTARPVVSSPANLTLKGVDISNRPGTGLYIANSQTNSVSPDGQWLLVNKAGKLYLEDMTGKMTSLPVANPGYSLYGSTADGGVIVMHSAGEGGLAFTFSPGKGITMEFPGNSPNAKIALIADESRNGNWAVLVSNSIGAGPQARTWLNISGHPVQSLRDANTFLWSPNGSSLAVLLKVANPSDETLALYDPHTKRITLRIAIPNALIHASPQIPITQLSWSALGTYVGIGTNHGIYVVNRKTHDTFKVSVTVPEWNWITDNQLYYVASNHSNASSVVFVGVTNHSLHTESVIKVPGTIQKEQVISSGVMAVQNDRGALYLVSQHSVQRLVSKRIGVWWYDRSDSCLYYNLLPSLQVRKVSVGGLAGVH